MELKKIVMIWAFSIVMMTAVVGTLVKNSGVCTFNRLTGRDKEKRKENKK